MSNYFFYTQIGIAALVGFFMYRLMRWWNRKFTDETLAEVRRRILRWPYPAPNIWLLLVPFIAFGQRLSRPSSRLAKQLDVGGFLSIQDDREFGVFRNVMSLFSMFVGGCVATLFIFTFDFTIKFWLLPPILLGGFVYAWLGIRISDRYRRVQRQVSRGFPSFLDVFSLTLESGRNFQSALQLTVQQLPSVGSSSGIKAQLQELLRDCLSQGSRIEALQRFAERLAIPEVVQFSAAVISAERQGVSVSALLRRQAEQLRTSQALAAERHAMKLPVKLLAPLAICIFPCTFLVLAFPLVVRLSGSGLF